MCHYDPSECDLLLIAYVEDSKALSVSTSKTNKIQ